MQTNKIVKGAVGAMLFGGTLGAAGQASAGLTWNASGGGGGPGLIPVISSNYAISYDSGPNDSYLLSSTANGWNFEAFQGTVNGATGPTTISFSAVTGSGYSVSVSGSTADGYVNVRRAFTVTDTQQITISWTGRTSAAIIGLANAPDALNGWGTVAALSAQGWVASTQPNVPGGSQINSSVAGTFSYTFTLGAGNYYVANTVSLVDAGASMSFAVVPAPGALALLGLAGVAGSRRRR